MMLSRFETIAPKVTTKFLQIICIFSCPKKIRENFLTYGKKLFFWRLVEHWISEAINEWNFRAKREPFKQVISLEFAKYISNYGNF